MNEIAETEVFAEWLAELDDERARARITSRVARFAAGNFGDVKPVGEGVLEARIDHGPGYRVYYFRTGGRTYLLLCGGDKSTQDADIRRAIKMSKEL